MMEYITLKNSALKVSRICMGGCPMGGYGWGEVQENELIDAVHAALDQGITFFDTADTYGLGQSEITLGRALGKHRKDVIVASKFGVRVRNGKTVYDNSPEWIREALYGSLERLETDYIDSIIIITIVIIVVKDAKREELIKQTNEELSYLFTNEPLKAEDDVYSLQAKTDNLINEAMNDSKYTLDDIQNEFGSDIKNLVDTASEPDKSLSWEDRKKHTINIIKAKSFRN